LYHLILVYGRDLETGLDPVFDHRSGTFGRNKFIREFWPIPYDTYSACRERRSIAYRSTLVLSLFESESATSRMLASSIFGLKTDVASIDVLAEGKNAVDMRISHQ
jgi:hypothetical protein